MIPGFAIIYKDNDGLCHLYFCPGCDDNGNNIYNDIDWSTSNLSGKFEDIVKADGSHDYVFTSRLKSISCKLTRRSNNVSEIFSYKYD